MAFVVDSSVTVAWCVGSQATAASRRPSNRAERIGINVHGEPVALHELLDLARRLELAVYDAAYPELARRLGLPLASLDAAQLAAARRAGIATL